MPTTTLSNLINPEVIGEMIQANMGERVVFGPVTSVDNTLVGRPGDTLKFPSFEYIGAAGDVAENAEVPVVELNSSTAEVTVKKYAKGVQLTDEALNSGFGDPLGEAARQLARAIDQKSDNDLHGVLKDAPWGRVYIMSALGRDSAAEALTYFGEDLEGVKVLYCRPEDLATLRKDPSYITASDLGQRMISSGVVGEVWGCQIILSEKLKADAYAQKSFICKPDALKLVMKESVTVEVEREPKYMRSTVYASEHAAPYLYNEGSVVVLYNPVSMYTIIDPAITIDNSGSSKKLLMPANYIPLSDMGGRWYYVMSDASAPAGVLGTPLTGEKPVTEAVTNLVGSKAYVHLYFCKPDKSPVACMSLLVGT